MSNADSRTFFVVMALQIPEVICSRGMEHPQDPVGFLPVFDSEASARAHAGNLYHVHPIRLVPPRIDSSDRRALSGPNGDPGEVDTLEQR